MQPTSVLNYRLQNVKPCSLSLKLSERWWITVYGMETLFITLLSPLIYRLQTSLSSCFPTGDFSASLNSPSRFLMSEWCLLLFSSNQNAPNGFSARREKGGETSITPNNPIDILCNPRPYVYLNGFFMGFWNIAAQI